MTSSAFEPLWRGDPDFIGPVMPPMLLWFARGRPMSEWEGSVPIRAERKGLYPANWKEIRAEILARANNVCEGSPRFPDCRAVNYEPHPVTGSKVVLTIAHLNHDETCDDPEQLRAWCQRCHLVYDAAHHARNAAETRRKKLAVADLFA